MFINGSNASGVQVFDNYQNVLSSASTSKSKLHPAFDSQHSTTSTPGPSSSTPNLPEPLHSSQSFTALELDNFHLMGHYFTHVWRTVASDSDGEVDGELYELWHDIIPGLAIKHPFLLHALLALSAVHIAQSVPSTSISTSTSVSMANLAQHHHTLSLPLMRQALSSPMDSVIIQPLFACATFIAMYAFAHYLIPGIHSAAGPVEEFAQALTMLRGTAAIVRSGPGLLEETPFKLMLLPTPSNPEAPLIPEIESYLSALKAAHARMTWPGGSEEAEGYSFMIGMLRHTFILHYEEPTRQMAAIPFAVLLPEPVLSGIHDQKPFALCLVAGYATVLHRLKQHLWIQGWGKRVIDGIGKKLAGSEWEEIVAWPLEVASQDISAL